MNTASSPTPPNRKLARRPNFRSPGNHSRSSSNGKRQRVIPARYQDLLDELKALLEGAGIHVRRERLIREAGYHVRSGLCTLRGERMLLLDWDVDLDSEIDLYVDAAQTCGVSLDLLSDASKTVLGRRHGGNGRSAVAKAANDG